ncbi:hypothetical protein KEM56_005061, partial [Ascosphaera pollenicola]
MVRLDQASSFRSRTAAQCLSIAHAALGPLADAVKSVQMLPSGLALVPSSASTHAQLLSSYATLTKAFAASAVDEQTGRNSYVMLFAPPLHPSGGHRPATSSKTMLEAELTPDAYHAELSAVLGVALAHIHMADNSRADSCTLFVSFPRGSAPTTRTVTVFGARLRLVRSRQTGNRKVQQ